VDAQDSAAPFDLISIQRPFLAELMDTLRPAFEGPKSLQEYIMTEERRQKSFQDYGVSQ
jgi:hypothetical protein